MVSIVGFLKKQPLRGEGILLIDLNGERLLGINRSFMEMTNGKIKPRSLLME